MNTLIQLLGTSFWEITATLCAVASVVLIARQNLLGWPIGMVWALISAYLAFSEWNLISDAILYVSYVPIQLYCWMTWKHAGRNDHSFHPTWLPRSRQILILVTAAGAIVVWGLSIAWLSQKFAWLPTPALLWRDATTTVFSYFAQFLQARKRMENWLGWLIVNLLGIQIYWLQGSTTFALQYGFFLILGLYGWWSWQRARKEVMPC